MAKFCLQCGAQLREDAAFCNVCGATVRQKVQPVVQDKDSTVCSKCGAVLRPGAKFCLTCGNTIEVGPQIQLQQQVKQQVTDAVRQGAGQVMSNAASAAAASVGISNIPGVANVSTITASTEAGMTSVDIGSIGLENISSIAGIGSGISEGISTILSPMKTFSSIFTRIGSGIKNIKQKPQALIPVIALGFIWLILFIVRRSGDENFLTSLLSFLTYGGDASERSLIGTAGTALGRGTVVCALTSLVAGGTTNIKDGFGKLFGKAQSYTGSGSAGWLITGLGLSLIVNQFLTGIPLFANVIGVVSLALVSIQAFGNEHSWLYSMARSITATVMSDRTRTANIAGIRKIMTGLIAGFTFMIPFSALNSVVEEVTYDSPLSYLPVIAGVILLIVGIIIAVTGKKQPVHADNTMSNGTYNNSTMQGRR